MTPSVLSALSGATLSPTRRPARWLRAAALALGVASLLPLTARAQLSYVPASAQIVTGTYTDLGTSGSTIAVVNTDDANSAAQAIGFTFSYAGQSFTQFVLSTNGFLKLGSTAPSATTLYYTDPQTFTGTTPFNSTAAADVNLIAAFNCDLAPSTTGATEFRRVTTGTAPNRICTVQWKNMADFGTAAFPTQYDNVNFQIKLYEGSNRIEFVYGSFTATTNTPGFRGAEVGLRGAGPADYLTSTKSSGAAWSATAFQAANYTVNRHNFRADVGPTAGLTYRFDVAAGDGGVAEIYSLSKLPVPQGAPHVVSAAIVNGGLGPLTALPVTLTVSGVTTFSNTKTIASLAAGDTAVVTFNAYTPTTTGTNTLTVSVPADINTANDTKTWTQTVGITAYRYADANDDTGGSVGYATSAGTLLVKHTTATASTVANTRIWLAGGGGATRGNSIGRTVYAVVADASGTILAQTSPYVIQAADTGRYKTFTFALAVPVTGSFYAGLAQTSDGVTEYYPVGNQIEDPLRTGAYFAGTLAGGTAPTDFTALPLAAPLTTRLMVEVTMATTCATPANFALGTVAASTAGLSYGAVAGALGYTLIYGPVGFDPTTSGTSVNVTTTSPTLTGLTSQTTYDVYVRTRCTSTSLSNVSAPLTFTTLCATTAFTLPYLETFDGVSGGNVLPCGYTIINANGDTARWRNVRDANVNQSSGPNQMRIETGTDAKDDWFVTPAITLAAGQSVDLSFQYRTGGGTVAEGLEVRAGRAATVADLTTTVFNDANILNAGYLTGTGAFTATTAGAYYFGFHATSVATAFRLYVDDVRVVAAPACRPPTLLTALGTAATTSTVTFTPVAGTTNFTVIYGPTGFDPATAGTSVAATSGTVSLTGLTASTTYQVYVRATCGAAGNSTLVGPVTFATLCATTARTLPYFENFDGVSGGNVLPCGYTIINANGDTARWRNVRDANVNQSSSPNQMRIETTTGVSTKDDWFVTPGIQLAAGQFVNLSFQYRAANSTDPEALEVKVGRTATVAGLTTAIFNVASLLNPLGVYETGTGTFTATTADTYYFGFHAYGGTASFRLYLDDVSLTSSCLTPTLATTASTAICPGGSVALTASGGGAGATYQFLLNGQPISGAIGTAYTATQAGTYTVTATAGACTTTSTTTVAVTLNAVPAAPTATPGARCGPGTVTLTASGAPTGGSYKWYSTATGGTAISSVASYTTPSISSTTTYYVSAVNATSCESSRTAVVATINAVPAPTLTPGGPTTFCAGGSVTLTAADGGPGATYQFLLGGQPISGATGATYLATQSGQYAVTATTSTCAGTSAALSVLMDALPAAPTTTPVARCGPGPVTVTAFGAPSGGSYRWYTVPTGGTPIAGWFGASQSPTLSVTTTYYVSTASAANCESPRTPLVATINALPAPTLTAGGPTTFCAGAAVLLTATGTGTYQFLLDGRPISGATGTSYVATQTGLYSVTASTATCSGTSAAVSVTATPPPSADFAYATSTFCLSGTNPSPAITGAAGGTFSSTSGLTLNAATGVINLSASTSGTYVVTYALTTPCPATATQTVTVTTAPSATFSFPSGVPLCAGSTATLTPTLGAGASAGTFSATPAGLSFDAVTGAVDVSTSAAGTYTIVNNIAASGTCAAATASATLTLAPGATATLAAGGPTTFCAGGSVTLTASGSGTFRFLLNGQPVSGTTATTLVATQAGTYTVTATTAGGCPATSAPLTVTVNAVPSAAFAYATPTLCLSGTNPVPTVAGAAGGVFSSTTGLTIDGATGAVNLSASTTGTYVVTYTVGGPCPATATQSLTLTAPAAAAFVYPTAPLCAGSGSTAQVQIAPGATLGTFSSTPAGLSLDPVTGTISAGTSVTGAYTVTNTVTGTGGCADAISTTTVIIEATPAVPTILVQLAGIVMLTSSATTGNQWYLNGAPISGATNQTYTVTAAAQNGLYCLVITSAAGCASTQTCYAVTVTGTALLLADQLVQLAPNPTQDGRAALLLTVALTTDCPLLVFDATGRRVLETVVPRGTTRHELDMRALPVGVYAVRLLTPAGAVVRRLVRQ